MPSRGRPSARSAGGSRTGARRPARWARFLAFPLLAAVACADSDTPTSPAASSLFSCLYGDGIRLEAGDVAGGQGGAASAVCLDADREAAEYLLVPFHFSTAGGANLAVSVSAGGSVPPSPIAAETASAGTATGAAAVEAGPGGIRDLVQEMPARDWDFHQALREREIRELTPLIPAARAAYGQATGAPEGEPPAALSTNGGETGTVPEEGDLLELNAGATCEGTNPRVGRVVAVGEHSLVVADTTNPAGGFTTEDYERFAAAFDTLIYPLNTEHFGERTDLDGSGRTTLFFTRAVNERTPPGAGSFIAGFFWAGDLFPRSPSFGLQGCPGSNFREMFYLLVPDPQGETGNVRTTDFVERITLAVVGHEDQHLINAARRIYITEAVAFETTWLNEALSHLAEELLYYATTPFSPGENLSRSDVFASPELIDRFNRYIVFNLVNFGIFLERHPSESPLGPDGITTRGSAWAFLRYLADHQERPQPAFFRDLVDGPGVGLANLEAALGTAPMDRLREWTVANYTDDVVAGLPAVYTQPSWNFRSILRGFGGTEGFPLPVRPLPAGQQQNLAVKGGSAAHLRFGVPAGHRAVLEFTSGGGPPSNALRWSLLRIH